MASQKTHATITEHLININLSSFTPEKHWRKILIKIAILPFLKMRQLGWNLNGVHLKKLENPTCCCGNSASRSTERWGRKLHSFFTSSRGMLYLSYWLKHPIILYFYPIIIRFSTLAQEQIGWRRVSTSRAGEITCSDNN